MKKGFDQRQQLVIVKKAGEIGIKEAANVAGVHYTTVYEWRRELDVLGEAFLKWEPRYPGRGIKAFFPVTAMQLADKVITI